MENKIYFILFIIILVILCMVVQSKKSNVYNLAYTLGTQYLDSIVIDPKYAVMFDIDDTLLDSKTFKPIKPIIKLLHECNDRGLTVLIITARDSIYTDATIQDLLDLKIYPKNVAPKRAAYYDFLYLRHSPSEDHELFKSNVKEKLAKHGIFTIMSIGDNEIDVTGKFSGYAIKLPNIRDPRLFHTNARGQLVQVIK